MKNAFKSAFIDTAPFIYLIEGHSQFAPIVKEILIYCQTHSVRLTTSVLTELEFKTKPSRDNRTDLLSAFDAFITESKMQLAIVTPEVVRHALDLRKQLESLKAMDSLQLGTAMTYQCDVFITNDKRLTPLKQLQIITLDQWK